MFGKDFVEWFLLISLTIGLLMSGWGVSELSNLTDHGRRLADQPMNKLLEKVSERKKILIRVSIWWGSLIFASCFALLIMYANDKYY